jgi:hypothetical protein
VPSSTIHENLDLKPEVTVSSDRTFGLVWAVFLSLDGVAPLRHAGGVRIWALVAAGLLFGISLSFPKALHIPNLLWAKIALRLHRVINPIVMGLVFYGCFVPVGLWNRIRRKDPLHLRLDGAASTYWIGREPPNARASTSMNNQF